MQNDDNILKEQVDKIVDDLVIQKGIMTLLGAVLGSVIEVTHTGLYHLKSPNVGLDDETYSLLKERFDQNIEITELVKDWCKGVDSSVVKAKMAAISEKIENNRSSDSN